MDRLREGLTPVVTMVRQLGIDPEEASRIFDEMLRLNAGAAGPEEEEDES